MRLNDVASTIITFVLLFALCEVIFESEDTGLSEAVSNKTITTGATHEVK